jgi:hypothetical protein
MSEPTTFEIVLRGRASARLLRPLLDDFTFDHPADGTTHLVGEVRDAAHLHGVVSHLTSVNVELVSIAQVDRSGIEATVLGHTRTPNEWSTHS